MEDLTPRQQSILRFSISRRFTDNRSMAREVSGAFHVPLDRYRTELAAALAHPRGPGFVREAIREGLAASILSQDLRDVLLFEAEWRPGRGRKSEVIRERFGFGSSTYYNRLATAVQHPTAARITPTVVRRHAAALRVRRAT